MCLSPELFVATFFLFRFVHVSMEMLSPRTGLQNKIGTLRDFEAACICGSWCLRSVWNTFVWKKEFTHKKCSIYKIDIFWNTYHNRALKSCFNNFIIDYRKIEEFDIFIKWNWHMYLNNLDIASHPYTNLCSEKDT